MLAYYSVPLGSKLPLAPGRGRGVVLFSFFFFFFFFALADMAHAPRYRGKSALPLWPQQTESSAHGEATPLNGAGQANPGTALPSRAAPY